MLDPSLGCLICGSRQQIRNAQPCGNRIANFADIEQRIDVDLRQSGVSLDVGTLQPLK
jgi:hypothetical protein